MIFISRLYICQQCRGKDTDENMVKVKVGKVNKRYHRQNCYNEYLEDQEFKKWEREQLDLCYEVIKDVCDVSTITPSFMGLIQRLRNGNPIVGMRKEDTKKFKQGFPYEAIALSFEKQRDLIKWKKNQWDGSSGRFLHYVLTYYIMDVIEDANNQLETSKLRDEQIRNNEPNPIEDIDFTNKIKKNDEDDISNFL